MQTDKMNIPLSFLKRERLQPDISDSAPIRPSESTALLAATQTMTRVARENVDRD